MQSINARLQILAAANKAHIPYEGIRSITSDTRVSARNTSRDASRIATNTGKTAGFAEQINGWVGDLSTQASQHTGIQTAIAQNTARTAGSVESIETESSKQTALQTDIANNTRKGGSSGSGSSAGSTSGTSGSTSGSSDPRSRVARSDAGEEE